VQRICLRRGVNNARWPKRSPARCSVEFESVEVESALDEKEKEEEDDEDEDDENRGRGCRERSHTWRTSHGMLEGLRLSADANATS